MPQATLFGTSDAHESERDELRETLEILYIDLQLVRQMAAGNYGLIPWDLERYGPERLWGPFWFLLYDLPQLAKMPSVTVTRGGKWVDEDPSLYESAPKVENYKIGCYRTGHSEDTERYVMDRAKWAIPVTIERIKQTALEYAEAYKKAQPRW